MTRQASEFYPTKTFTAKTVSDLFEVVDQLVKVPALDVGRKRVEKEAAGSVEDAGR
jgi:hypothetical protein